MTDRESGKPRSLLAKVVFGISLYAVGCVLGFLYLASEGGVAPGMSTRQFLLALLVWGPCFPLAMGLLEGAVQIVCVELPRRVWRWLRSS